MNQCIKDNNNSIKKWLELTKEAYKNQIMQSFMHIFNKIFEGVFTIIEKSDNKEQMIKSIENFKKELLEKL